MAILPSLGYNIYLGNTVFSLLTKQVKNSRYTTIVILCDENTLRYCLPVLIRNCPVLSSAEIIEVESGESSKSIPVAEGIWQTLLEQKADKKSLLINLGGGMVSDLGGFVASVYKRGIDFINLPTTLLAMADASVGGKTGLNFSGVKNSLGTFQQPKAVYVYPGFLSTLPRRQLLNGWVEIVKMALIADKKFWSRLKTTSLETNPEWCIQKSLELKNKVVKKDPKDTGIRKILNFGHSIGHAIEAFLLDTPYELLHGEAICIGMLIESDIAFQKKLLTETELTDIQDTLSHFFGPYTKLPLPYDEILLLLKQDKKNTSAKLNFSLLDKIGQCIYDCSVSEVQIKKAFQSYQKKHG